MSMRNVQASSSSEKCTAPWASQELGRRPFTDPIEIPAVSGARDVVVERGAGRREKEEREEEEVVPPHMLLEARRRAAFSVCSGHGRTLKGRDLTRTRDSVLRMTGFIEG